MYGIEILYFRILLIIIDYMKIVMYGLLFFLVKFVLMIVVILNIEGIEFGFKEENVVFKFIK